MATYTFCFANGDCGNLIWLKDNEIIHGLDSNECPCDLRETLTPRDALNDGPAQSANSRRLGFASRLLDVLRSIFASETTDVDWTRDWYLLNREQQQDQDKSSVRLAVSLDRTSLGEHMLSGLRPKDYII